MWAWLEGPYLAPVACVLPQTDELQGLTCYASEEFLVDAVPVLELVRYCFIEIALVCSTGWIMGSAAPF
jgi:hypothetical protein